MSVFRVTLSTNHSNSNNIIFEVRVLVGFVVKSQEFNISEYRREYREFTLHDSKSDWDFTLRVHGFYKAEIISSREGRGIDMYRYTRW